jgi:hypothetical protein
VYTNNFPSVGKYLGQHIHRFFEVTTGIIAQIENQVTGIALCIQLLPLIHEFFVSGIGKIAPL